MLRVRKRVADTSRMTALTQYERLEAPGLWRGGEGEQRRNVIVLLGEATLTIADMAEHPLTHWSLPAVRRLNPGSRPALYSPGTDLDEELELDDDTMIEALGRVRNAITRQTPRPGRLRFGLQAAGVLGFAALGLFWLPGALTDYTARVVPEPTRAAVGQRLLARITRVTGAPCSDPAGRRALGRLATRVLGPGQAQVMVLPGGPPGASHLPGGILLLNRAVIEDYEEPDVAAGYLLAEALRRELDDPMRSLLSQAGLGATLRLLTSGQMPDAALDTYAQTLVTRAPAPVPTDMLVARFADARLRSSPYAFALDQTGERSLALIEADPVPISEAGPLIDDGSWISLQGICGE